MKLFYCPTCRQLVDIMRADGEVRYCFCGSHCGKYLADNMTGVFTYGAIIVGIDNNTWLPAVQRYKKHNPNGEEPFPSRIDFFFTGWIPTEPGEVVFVDWPDEVHDFPMDGVTNTQSTMPNSQQKCSKSVCYCNNNGVCLNRKEWDK